MTNDLKQILAILQRNLQDISMTYKFSETDREMMNKQFIKIHQETEKIEDTIIGRKL